MGSFDTLLSSCAPCFDNDTERPAQALFSHTTFEDGAARDDVVSGDEWLPHGDASASSSSIASLRLETRPGTRSEFAESVLQWMEALRLQPSSSTGCILVSSYARTPQELRMIIKRLLLQENGQSDSVGASFTSLATAHWPRVALDDNCARKVSHLQEQQGGVRYHRCGSDRVQPCHGVRR